MYSWLSVNCTLSAYFLHLMRDSLLGVVAGGLLQGKIFQLSTIALFLCDNLNFNPWVPLLPTHEYHFYQPMSTTFTNPWVPLLPTHEYHFYQPMSTILPTQEYHFYQPMSTTFTNPWVPFFFLSDLFFVNTFSSWIWLKKYCSLDIKQQFINKSIYIYILISGYSTPNSSHPHLQIKPT